MAPIEFGRDDQRAKGPANILAIGTANPPIVRYQDEFPDFLFRVSKSENMEDLKFKFKRICESSMIRKRHTQVSEKFLNDNPNVFTRKAPSLDTRLDFEIQTVPKLGSEAALKAIEEWGRPKSSITHVVFHTYSGLHMPGADYQLVQILGLEQTVKRYMLYHNGCYAGGTVLRLAKDLAENNAGARVLAVCSESMLNGVHKPSYEDSLDQLVAYAIFGDGAAAAIVGADPDMSIERPIYQMISANQVIIPNSNNALSGRFYEIGFTVTLSKDVAGLVAKNIESNMARSFDPLGVTDWNSLFWIVHPGGATILNAIEAKLGLKEEKLKPTRHVLSEYGNMSSPTVIFILDEMRKRSQAEGKVTTGDGLDMGVLIGIGPGMTMETIVLRSFPTNTTLSV